MLSRLDEATHFLWQDSVVPEADIDLLDPDQLVNASGTEYVEFRIGIGGDILYTTPMMNVAFNRCLSRR